jgi:hypothetical protein
MSGASGVGDEACCGDVLLLEASQDAVDGFWRISRTVLAVAAPLFVGTIVYGTSCPLRGKPAEMPITLDSASGLDVAGHASAWGA